jgi:hypothetical protein
MASTVVCDMRLVMATILWLNGAPVKPDAGSARAGVAEDDAEWMAGRIGENPEALAVELGESPWVRAVDHSLFEMPDHKDSISASAATATIAGKILRPAAH